MDVTINFEKKTLSKRVGKLLIENVQNDEEKESIKKIMDGKKLQYPQANRLIFSLIAAMLVEDGEDDDDEEEFGDAKDTQLQSPTQKLTQTQDENDFPSGSGQDGKKKNEQGKIPDQTQRRTDFKDVCRFFKNGNCKFGEKCRNEHPKMCKKFKKHGISKHNQNGCDGKCGMLHPNACRESLKTKECSRSECKFYHLKGTKLTASQEGVRRNETHRNGQRGESEKQDSNLVFQQVQMEMLNTIRSLKEEMEEIRMWMRPQNPTLTQPRSPPRMSQENWRYPHKEGNWRSQQTQWGGNQLPRN